MKSGWSFRRKYFVGDQSRTTTDRGEAERFRLLPRSTNGNSIRPRPARAGGRVQALSSIDSRYFFNARRDAGAPFSRVASAGGIGRRPVAGIAGGQSRVSLGQTEPTSPSNLTNGSSGIVENPRGQGP